MKSSSDLKQESTKGLSDEALFAKTRYVMKLVEILDGMEEEVDDKTLYELAGRLAASSTLTTKAD